MTQCDQLLLLLQAGWVSPQDAIEVMKCYRLAARIHDLKKRGYDIEDRTVRHGDVHWSEYRLRRPVQRELFAEVRV